MSGKRVALLAVIVLLVALVFAAGGWFAHGLLATRVPMMGLRGGIPSHNLRFFSYPRARMLGGFFVLWQGLAALGAVTGTTALILTLTQGSKQTPAEIPAPPKPPEKPEAAE
jgi:hypothetical protein